MASDSRDAEPSRRGGGLGLQQNPLRFNTGPPGGGKSDANRSLRSGHAAVRRGVDGVETLRDALASGCILGFNTGASAMGVGSAERAPWPAAAAAIH